MSSKPSECPDGRSLQAALQGPDDNVDAGLAVHLEHCDSCRSALERLAGGDLASAPVPVSKSGAVLRDADVAEVVSKLKQTPPAAAAGALPMPHDVSLEFLTPTDDPQSLGRLGQYEILEVIGHGGMGIVLKALDPRLRRIVAMKVLAPQWAVSASARRRFLREAQAAAAVSHNHVVTIHAVEEHGPLPYLVMEYICGESLQERLDRAAPLATAEILRIGRQIALGLAAAHAQGLIHRDIKPANILLENGVQRVKITDFGLARAVDDASLTQVGQVAGTPQYMAPEQAGGEHVDARADLFSLGSVLYAMCTGEPPFRGGSSLAVLQQVRHEPPRPIEELNPETPQWLIALIGRLLAKDPHERIQSAAEVAEILQRQLAALQRRGPTNPRTAPTPKPKWLTQCAAYANELRWVIAVLAVLLAISVISLGIGRLPKLAATFQPAELLQSAGPPTRLRLFTPESDTPITQDGVVAQEDAWKIDAGGARRIQLFEASGVDAEQCVLTYRARLKSEDVRGQAYLEMWCRIPGVGEFFSRGLDHPISGSTGWATYETPFYLQKGQRCDFVRLNLVFTGPGTIWVRDVELLRAPLPSTLERSL